VTSIPDPIFLATAVEAALAAGQVQRQYFRALNHELKIDKKGPIDLVTAADLQVEREFRQLVHTRFPTHSVLGEEQGSGVPDGAAPSRYRWIIDPIDGTTNFAHGLALFCCSIALEIDGVVAVGVVYDPMAEELFTAERGAGAWLNGAPLRVSACDQMLEALLCTGFPYSVHEQRQRMVAVFEEFLGIAQGVRRLGSAALDLCYVGAGRFEGFWEHKLQPWDFAAAALVVEEAGGRVTDYQDAPVDMFRGQIVASNGHVHRAMIDAIGRAEAR
jgi:myo-inositol-1(or 4)-monophosphatase